MKNANVAVLLAGCGVYDGSEIHETVLTLLALVEAGASYQCIAPDKVQYHTINHLNGEIEPTNRNVLQEAARIARGDIQAIGKVNLNEFDALLIPGGFGAAKNLNQWAIAGPEGKIDPEVKALILHFVEAQKPVGAMCMGPTVVAQALAGTSFQAKLTVGSTEAASPYDIAGISAGMAGLGVEVEMKLKTEITIDAKLKIVSSPCYMMEADILDVRTNTKQLVSAVLEMIN